MERELGGPSALSLVTLAIGLFLLFFASCALASERPAHFVFDRLSDHLGGRQSTVYEIFEDPFGFLWFAGDTDGILRFDSEDWVSWSDGLITNNARSNISTVRVTADGRLWVGSWGNGLQYWDPDQQAFVQFLADSSDSHALAANRVQRLMIDSRDRLWIGTTGGINVIEPGEPDTIRRFAHDQPDHPLYSERIWGMVEHESGLWFATSGGLYRVSHDLSEWTHLLIDEAAAERFERGAEVRTVAVAHDQVWAGSQLGVFRWNAANDSLSRIEFEEDPRRSMPRVNAILESRRGGIWVGAHDGLYRIDENAPRFELIEDGYHLIPDVDIRALYEDSEGNLWIGSRDRGIIHGQRHDRVFNNLAEQAPAELADEASRLTSAILTDHSGGLWLGVPGGLLRRDHEGRWSAWEFPASTGVRRVEGMAQSADGTVWVATDSGLFRITADDRLQADDRLFRALNIAAAPVNAILADDDQGLWLGLWNFGVVRWNPETGEVSSGVEELRETRADLVYQLNRDETGGIWAATRYSGIFHFNGDGWQSVPIQLGSRQHAPSFYCIHHRPPETLWLCTEDGLVRYRLADGDAEIYSSADGLPTNQITGLVKGESEDLWVLTSRGVARRMPDKERFVNYGLADGLPGLAVQRNALDRTPEGQIVIGTSNGAVTLDPESLARGLNAPRAVLSRVWLDGEELTRYINPARLQLALPSDHRDLLLQFAVLDFHEPERNLARVRLRGYEPSFSELNGNRELRYMNLPPGDYVLEIEGWSSRGVPGEAPLEIPIQVAAPWWHSPLAWIAAALLLVALGWLMIQLRLRALSASNKRLQELVEERTQALEAANRRLRERSARDFLTGLFNRRGFSERFGVLQQLAVRGKSDLAVVLFDLDHFKRINDMHGHEIGDQFLKVVGKVLSDSLRGQDLAARWGGEEFLLALPGTNAEGAVQLCEKIRSRLASAQIRAQDQVLRITATFGIVSRNGDDRPLESWVKAADEAMYRGKEQGRDQVQVFSNDNDL